MRTVWPIQVRESVRKLALIEFGIVEHVINKVSLTDMQILVSFWCGYNIQIQITPCNLGQSFFESIQLTPA